MDFINQDIILFFDKHQTLLPLYEVFVGKMTARNPDVWRQRQSLIPDDGQRIL